MTSIRKTLFISDLHLEESQPQLTHQFLSFLQSCDPSSVDALYILGDFFEAWIGDDHETPLHSTLIKALKSATEAGLTIYFMHGNRDFLVGQRFMQQTGCQLLAEETKIMLYHTPVLLLHGDTLCTKDQAYLKTRKKLRHPLIQKLFLWLPLSMRKKIAANMRATSKQYTQSASSETMDAVQTTVVQTMQKHAATHLIHGHTHKPGFHQFKFISNDIGLRLVLGAWHERGNVLIWHASGKKELIEFRNE